MQPDTLFLRYQVQTVFLAVFWFDYKWHPCIFITWDCARLVPRGFRPSKPCDTTRGGGSEKTEWQAAEFPGGMVWWDRNGMVWWFHGLVWRFDGSSWIRFFEFAAPQTTTTNAPMLKVLETSDTTDFFVLETSGSPRLKGEPAVPESGSWAENDPRVVEEGLDFSLERTARHCVWMMFFFFLF